MVKQYAAIAMRGRPALDGFMRVEIEISHTIPTRFTKKKRDAIVAGKLFPTICDLDNQTKALCDAMNKVVYNDDRRIAVLTVIRRYGPEDKAVVTVQLL